MTRGHARGWAAAPGAAVLAVMLAALACGAGRTPTGQPALIDLSPAALDVLRTDFNQQAADVRVVLLLSPT